MDNPGEIMRLCRLCLVKDQVNIPIFEEQGDIRQIFLKISSCLPVKVSREDKLPKKICDGCSSKLDLLYEFWTTSANAEKTLLSWLGQAGVKDVEETTNAVVQHIAKPSETQVKEEALEDGHATAQSTENAGLQNASYEEGSSAKDECEEPPPKRVRRTAAVKAQINIAPDSDDDEDDLDNSEPMTKIEDESEESDGEDKDPSYPDVPGTSADDDQPGPSGVGKDGVEAPSDDIKIEFEDMLMEIKQEDDCYNIIVVGNTKYECEVCQKVFSVREHALEHKYFHTGEKPFRCEICGERFMFSRFLDSHRRELHYEILTGDPLVKFDCKICKKHYTSASGLYRHNLSKHNDSDIDLSVLCDICGKMLSSKEELKFHRCIHTDSKPFACEVCAKSFTKMDHLVEDVLVRTRKKSHICRYCGRGFSQKTPLKIHERTHSNSKPFVCICCKSFVTKGDIGSHMRSCNGKL